MDPSRSYRQDAVPPDVRFDEVETTVSHLFRRPHVALAGRSFGGALHDALSSRGLIREPEVVELGAGVGFVAAAMVARAKDAGRPLRYGFVDLSQRLLAVQRRQVPDAFAACASALQLPLRTGCVRGLFLANEVIADLPVAPAAACGALAQRLSLSFAPGELVNSGALLFLEEVARVLGPGGAACLTEFGGDFAPSPVRLHGRFGAGDHVEHSIHFGHLEQAAHALGLRAERLLLADLLGVDRKVRVTSYADVMRLRRLVPRLPVLAFTREELEQRHPVLTRIFRFDLPEIGSPRFPDPQADGGFCQLFHALLLIHT